jgi:hypothetical protein
LSYRPSLTWRRSGVAAAASLDTGLFVRADQVLPFSQPPSLEDPGLEIQDHATLRANRGWREKNHDLWDHGRMASDLNLRHTATA